MQTFATYFIYDGCDHGGWSKYLYARGVVTSVLTLFAKDTVTNVRGNECATTNNVNESNGGEGKEMAAAGGDAAPEGGGKESRNASGVGSSTDRYHCQSKLQEYLHRE